MRDEARITAVMNYIESVWREHPDMRFGQLIINVIMLDEDCETSADLDKILWNIEEPEFMDLLDMFYDAYCQKKG
jgi:hypothetical protein